MGGRGNILINVLSYRTGQARQPSWKCNGSLTYLLHACAPPCWNSAVSYIKYISKVVYEKEGERERERNLLTGKKKKSAAYNRKGIVQSQSLAPLKHWTLIQRNKNTLRRLITIVHKKLPTSLGKLSTPSQRGRHFVIQFQTLTTDLSAPLKRDLPFRKISLLVIQTGLHFWGQDCSDSFAPPCLQ